jgi:pentapeptide MXKDX repeat protein
LGFKISDHEFVRGVRFASTARIRKRRHARASGNAAGMHVHPREPLMNRVSLLAITALVASVSFAAAFHAPAQTGTSLVQLAQAKKDDMKKDTMMKDEMKKDSMKKDDMKKDDMMKKDTMKK